MSPDGKVRVVVRSKRVPSGTVTLSETMFTLSGVPMGTRTNQLVLYDYVLDEDHQRTIREAQELARRLCLELEVIDSAKQGLFSRLLSSLGRRGSANPTVEVLTSSLTPSGRSPAMVQPQR